VQSTPGHGTCFSVHLPIEPVRKAGEGLGGSGEHRAAVERDGSASAPSPKPNAPALNTGLDAK
jgi:hypothetical protein